MKDDMDIEVSNDDKSSAQSIRKNIARLRAEVQKTELFFDYEEEFLIPLTKIIREEPNSAQNGNEIKLGSAKLSDPRRAKLLSLGSENKFVRPILVLDLDETLINAYTGPRTNEISKELKENAKYKDYELLTKNFAVKGPNLINVTVIIRPNLLDFLKNMVKYYDIHLYTHGRQEYVEEVLTVIDPQATYINRKRIFYHSRVNIVDEQTKKSLARLGLSPAEIKNAIIFDDLKQIWKEYDKVIPSKKFIPLFKFMDEKKYKTFTIEPESDAFSSNELRLEKEDLSSYSETDYVKKNQLYYLQSFLEELAFRFFREQLSISDPSDKQFPPLEMLAAEQTKMILRNSRIKVLTTDPKRKVLFHYIAVKLGAVIADGIEFEKITEVVVDSQAHTDVSIHRHLDEILIYAQQKNYTQLKIVKVDWLLQCYFDYHRKDPGLFRYD